MNWKQILTRDDEPMHRLVIGNTAAIIFQEPGGDWHWFVQTSGQAKSVEVSKAEAEARVKKFIDASYEMSTSEPSEQSGLNTLNQ